MFGFFYTPRSGSRIANSLINGSQLQTATISGIAQKLLLSKRNVYKSSLISLTHYILKIGDNKINTILCDLNSVEMHYWSLYRSLCGYKKSPCQLMAEQLNQAFDALCTPINNYESINIVLQDIQKKKDELMLVLSRPETSLHNNDSERDIRELAKRRKISSGTRSENGKMSRDTFLSIKKTCRKLNISFWEYLNDRFSLKNTIDQLNIIMSRQSSPSG